MMGNATYDTEASTPSGSSDDATGSDDETVTIPALTQGVTTTMAIPVLQATGKYLSGWIDWNGDGDFADAGEQVASNIVDGGAGDTNATSGTIGFSVRPPAGTTTAATWARFRLSSTNGISAASLVGDGEVEDHMLTIAGPAADLSLTKTVSSATPAAGTNVTFTLTVSNVAAATTTSTGITVRDVLPATLAYVSSSGTGTYDNATGIWTVGSLAPGASASLSIVARTPFVSNSAITNVAEVMTGSGLDPDSTVGNGITTEDDYASVSLTTQATTYNCPTGTTATGSGYTTGGTGLYQQQIFWLDWSCGGQTTFATQSTINKSWTVGDGLVIAGQLTGATFPLRSYSTGGWSGDVLDNMYPGVNPIGLMNFAYQSPTYNLQLTATLNGLPVSVSFIVGDAEDTGGSIEYYQVVTSGTPWVTKELTSNIALSYPTPTTARWDDKPQAGGGTPIISTDGSSVTLTSTHVAGGPQALAFGIFTPFDQSDAPLTGTSYGAASHRSLPGMKLGAGVTSEQNPYDSPNASADADDGVTMTQFIPSAATTMTVPVSGSGYLSAWIDWNDDGDFADSGEAVAANVRDGGAGDTDGAANGVILLSVTVPGTVPANMRTLARFRWSFTSGTPSSGLGSFGEVEDYEILIVGKAILTATKSSTVFDTGNGHFSIPGNDMLYTITVTNTTGGTPDPNSVLIVDPLPADLTFFNGDADGAGPGTTAVLFTDMSSGLTFDYATDVRYATGTTPPANFAACTYTPTAGYDPAVRYICINPSGTMAGTGTTPTPRFTLQFRARIK